MSDLEVTIDYNVGPALELFSGLRAQIPYAASVALNAVANDAQSAIRAALPGEFHLRRKDFIERTIYRTPGKDFATKANLAATVRVNPARDFLAKFEDESTKRSTEGDALAIPIPRQNTPGFIIGRNSPLGVKAVMALIANQGGKNVGPFKKRSTRKAQQQSFYLIKSRRTGQTLVIQRFDFNTTRVLYAFEQEVPITSHRLHFDEIALRAALANWDRRAEEALDKAISTMR